MKIKTDYDILTEVRHAKEGIKASEPFLDATLMNPFHTALVISDVTFSLLNNDMKGLAADAAIYGTLYISVYAFCDWYTKKHKQNFMEKSEKELQKLVNELSKLEVKTSLELLKEAKLNEVNYKIEYVDGSKLPKLKQYKYIDVPLSNGYEETLLQEHVFGNKSYELSVNSPIKKMDYKPVKSNA